jgi:hypothetical protein
MELGVSRRRVAEIVGFRGLWLVQSAQRSAAGSPVDLVPVRCVQRRQHFVTQAIQSVGPNAFALSQLGQGPGLTCPDAGQSAVAQYDIGRY